MAREIAESPASLEILASLLADQDRALPLPTEEAAPATLVMRRAAPADRQRRRSLAAAWAMAACVLIAAWSVVRSQSLKNEVAFHSGRARQATTALVVAEKERLADLEGSQANSYLLGATSSELTVAAIDDFAVRMRGTQRGGTELTAEQAAALEAARARLADAASQFDRRTVDGQLQYAAALLAAGRVDDAHELLDEIRQAAKAAAATQAQWENVRASLSALEAAQAPVSRAAPLWEEAESLFRSAAEGGLNDAWLNLA